MTKAVAALALFATTSGLMTPHQVELKCNGGITLLGRGTVQIRNEISVVDYERKTLKPPFYATLPILEMHGSTIVFGAENAQVSALGSLERISGRLVMNVTRRDERWRLDRNDEMVPLADISAKCKIDKSLF